MTSCQSSRLCVDCICCLEHGWRHDEPGDRNDSWNEEGRRGAWCRSSGGRIPRICGEWTFCDDGTVSLISLLWYIVNVDLNNIWQMILWRKSYSKHHNKIGFSWMIIFRKETDNITRMANSTRENTNRSTNNKVGLYGSSLHWKVKCLVDALILWIDHTINGSTCEESYISSFPQTQTLTTLVIISSLVISHKKISCLLTLGTLWNTTFI